MYNEIVKHGSTRWWKYFAILLPAVFLLFVFNLAIGSVYIPPLEVLKVIVGDATENGTWREIILNFRLPKSLTALLAGSALGVSGLMMQTFFRNPLAGPFVLGISSGASLGAALFILGGAFMGTAGWGGTLLAGGQVAASALGAVVVMLAVMAVARSLSDAMGLLIVGLMFSSSIGALVSVMQYFSQANDIQAYLLWSFGSLGGISWQEMQVFGPVILVGLITSFACAKPLNMLLLGESYAASMGLHIKRARLQIVVGACVLAGTVTAFCGPIAFIGIAAPYAVRLLFSTSNHLLMIPLVGLVGAGAMLFCDLVAQLPGSSRVLPVNVVTSLAGGPLVIWIIVSKRNLKNSL